MTKQKGFNGIISDIGGPTANMFHMDARVKRPTRCVSPCQLPAPGTLQALWHGSQAIPAFAPKGEAHARHPKVFVNSGIRYDLASLDDEFVEELALHHVQGHMSVAPEHAASDSLKYMKKPEARHFTDFMERFKKRQLMLVKNNFWCPISSVPIQGLDQKSALSLPYT